MKHYQLQEGVYIDPDNQGSFHYSDGDATENEILQKIREAADLSTGSEELVKAIHDWPTLYHLHPKRSNLLRPLADLFRHKHVLEIGCGCGAITRFLGELDAHVTALEGSYRRASITASRCRDLENVKVVCDNFLHFDTEERYDVITLIGVLEYAGLYLPGEDPFRAVLEKVRGLLRPGGSLVIAIENKLGLKYWAGAPEDHTGHPFQGIEDRYTPSTARTFAKPELIDLLRHTGFAHHDFLYPFPDYKLPTTLITEAGLRHEGFDAHMLLLENYEYVQSDYYASHFSTSLAGGEIEKNGLFADLSNSFLVIARSNPGVPVIGEDLLAVIYNVQRKKAYQKACSFRHIDGQGIRAERKRLYDELPLPPPPTPPAVHVFNRLEVEPYLRGPLLLWEAVRIISAKGWTSDQLTGWARRYYDILQSMASGKEELRQLDGQYIDLTPFNIVVTKDGEARIFDQEWVAPEPIGLDFIFFRGLYFSLGSISFFNMPAEDVPLDILDLCIEIYEHFMPFGEARLTRFREIEAAHFSAIGPLKYMPFTHAPLKIRKEVRIERQLRETEWEMERQKQRAQRLEQQLEENDKGNSRMQALYQQVEVLNIRLSEIEASEGWKLLSIYYRIRNKLLPRDSPRQKAIKKIFRWLRRKKGDDAPLIDHTGMAPEVMLKMFATPAHFDPFDFPVFAKPQVSIVIPAYNGWGMNYLCLRSILEHTHGVSYEVIFADDVSTDETQYVSQFARNIIHVRNEKNLGFLANCNHAAGLAKGKYILFLNNDTQVTAGWLGALVDLMEKDPGIGMTGSKLVYPNGRLQEAGGIIWKDASGWNFGHKQDPAHPMFNYVKDVDYISGASLMIRADLWKEIGGFDNRYAPAYFEDTDLAFEVRKRGKRVVYQPLSVIYHFEGFSHGSEQQGSLKKESIKNYQAVNREKFLAKWKEVLNQEHFPNGEHVFWARDRSRHKKTILVIDHYVPHFDKDAGSRHTFQYLQLFVEMGLNVKFIGDNFYKHEPYTTALQQMGIEVLYGDVFKGEWRRWFVENESKFDFIYLQRPHIAIKYIDFIRDHAHGKLIYFGHDLHYYREKKQYEVEKDPALLKSSEKWKETEGELIRKSDLVLTLSTLEKEIMEKEFGHPHIATMPIFFYDHFNEPLTNFSEREDILFVGGFGHKPNIDAVIWFAQEVFPLVGKQLKKARLIVVGSKPPSQISRLASENIIVKGHVTDTELAALYNRAKLVVIPLRYGAGVKGKTVEAIFQGIPFVTTSFGIEGLPEIGEVTGYQDEAGAFAERVTALYTDQQAWEACSRREIGYIKKHFAKENAIKAIQKIVSSAHVNQPA